MSGFSFLKRKKQQATVKKSGGKPFRKDIQALRAFAVAVVVLYHLWPERITGGFAGVDIFFVISGFLMTTSIMGRLKPLVTSGAVTVKNVFKLLSEFYARRISRLVPAALVVLSGTLLMAYLTNNLTVMVATAKNVIASATFWQNWNLANQSVDYLHAGDAATATEHFWSLSVEEQFYLMWPILLVGATLLTINIAVYYKKQRISGIILPITLLTLISFAYGYWLTQTEPSVAYFSTPARIWELMLGGIIAFLPVIKSYDLKLLLPHVGLAMCLYSVFFITGDGFPGWHALIPTIGTALIVWAGVGRAESKLSFDTIFALKPIQWIGNISYSIYLWHFPLIVLLPLIIYQSLDGSHGRLFKIGIIVLTLILAQLSYTYVEETTRKLRLKLRYIYILFAVATGLVVGGAFALQNYSSNKIDSDFKTLHADVLDQNNKCIGARAILNLDECDNPYGEWSSKYASIGQMDMFQNLLRDNFKQCKNIFKENGEDQSKFCSVGDTSSARSIAVFGDSHSQQYINAFDYIGKKRGIKFNLFEYTLCGKFMSKNIETKKDKSCIKRIEHIVKSTDLINSSEHVILSFWYRNIDFLKANINLVKEITAKDLFILSDSPSINEVEFEACNTLLKSCNEPIEKALKKNRMLKSLVEDEYIYKKNVIDTTDFYCTRTYCPQFIGGIQVYYNARNGGNSHITASYSYTLGPLLEQKLKSVGILK